MDWSNPDKLLYPARLMEGIFQKNTAERLIRMKLADYATRHKGKKPSRVFVSDAMWWDLIGNGMCNYQSCVTGEEKLFGIPASTFQADEALVYLSDEEE